MRIRSEESLRPRAKGSYRRTEFLRQFMDAMSMTVADFADLVELTRPTCSHSLSEEVDDIRLSYVQKAIEAKGYRLGISYSDPVAEASGDVRPFDVGKLVSVLSDNGLPMTRLSFLSVAMQRYGVTKVQLAQKLSLQPPTIRHMFSTDDIFLSRIYQIAELYRWNLRFLIEPQENTIEKPVTEPDGRSVEIDIRVEKHAFQVL